MWLQQLLFLLVQSAHEQWVQSRAQEVRPWTPCRYHLLLLLL
jgi:hypothetical protein